MVFSRAALLLLPLAAAAALNVTFHADDSFDVTIDGTPWLSGGGVSVQSGGKLLSTWSSTLAPTGPWEFYGGADVRGDFTARRRGYAAPGAAAPLVVVECLAYDGAVRFAQTFPAGLKNTGGDGVVAEWPILGPNATGLGVLTFQGRFMEGSKATAWTGAKSVTTGAYGGPLAFFDDAGRVLVASLGSHFATGAHAASARDANSLAFGILGSATSVPEGFSVDVALTYNAKGLTAAVKAHGASLLKTYGTERVDDYTTSYLGYSTDNGAYYYYKPNGTYERTLLDVHAYAQAERIPYRYALLDSWWYTKGAGGGVKNWTCTSETFPGGCADFSETTGWKFQLHNRMWSADNVYAKQNGGSYDFLVEGDLAIPTSQAFWDDLMAGGAAWGMAVYEQDWMYNEFLGLNATQTSATLAEDWLREMATGASNAGAAVQYCMEMARFVMQAVELPAVTQFRASDDYGAGNDAKCGFPYCVYYVGTTSLLAYALDLKPSKDNFWSTQVQPGNAFNNRTMERFSDMQAAIASLSSGPVQVSDGVGYSDRAVILRTCDDRGRLLQPSRPASAVDAAFAAAAGVGAGPAARIPNVLPVMATHTAIGAYKWGHILTINLAEDFQLDASHLAPADWDAAADAVVYTGYGAASNVTVSAFPVTLEACNESDFSVHHVAPLFDNGWAYLGEVAKWVPVAAARTASVAFDDAGVSVVLAGAPGEAVELAFYAPNKTVVAAKCVLTASGAATLAVSDYGVVCAA